VFLIRKGSKQCRAHLWNGKDTVCRMWSGGSLNRRKYECSDNLKDAQNICKVCRSLEKRKPDRLIVRHPPQSKAEGDGVLINQSTTTRQNWSREQWRNFMQTEEWLQEYRKIRYRTFLKYGQICMVCFTKGEEHNPIHCDHIKPRSRFPELSLDPHNMQVLCLECNYGKGNWDETDWRP
jgi:5-methylcytosine-specific restriction endonuclease McrA